MNIAELLTWLCVAACLSLGAFFLACREASDGLEPGAPIELTASAVEVLGSSDTLSVVRDLEVDSDGSVWILNEREPYFVGFGPDGEFVGAHGRAGGGPRDFPMPSGFLTGGWQGEAWVFDFARHAMIRVSRPEEWTEISLRSDSLPPGSVQGGMNMLAPSVRTAPSAVRSSSPARAVRCRRVCSSTASPSCEPIWSRWIPRRVAYGPWWPSAMCWTIPPGTSFQARAVSRSGIGCGLSAAAISCGCMTA